MMKINRLTQSTLFFVLSACAVGVFADVVGMPTVSELAAQRTQNSLGTMRIGQMFTYFILMLGPIKLLAPFVKLSQGLDAHNRRLLAFKGFFYACLAGLAAVTLGKNTLVKWDVGLPALLIAAGLVLLVVALKSILAQYDQQSVPTSDSPQPYSPMLALSPLAFPLIITPYGIAGFILLDAASPPEQNWVILGVFLAVMVLNLVAMLFARPIIKYGEVILTIFGAVLGVLQVALAVQMLLFAIRLLGILP